ncbi:hypothetical protein OV203_19370 [Nannocystis sp. ILAH1]|uniref:hypothetical protein n=1 Tax=unclassified Nannocystis TaxID=2627009 RepID=UPI002271B0B4|nr:MULTISPECIES: hypothetical protein [unclassified Nannocystis]MCY0989308.1 hypothetical protein [Nannocystis sp. ILAH1]MCY1064997.1 hypothetical protein [Nannocystis sp. RBIL2]
MTRATRWCARSLVLGLVAACGGSGGAGSTTDADPSTSSASTGGGSETTDVEPTRGTSATSSPAGAQLLYRQDFEAEGWEEEFTGRPTWEGHVAVVTHEPHGGSRSLRGNQFASVTDPITGLPGIGNALLDWRGAGHDIAERTPHQMYFSYWFRHDDFTYAAGNEGKLFYFVDANGCQLDAYFGGQLHSRDLAIAYNNGCQSNQWAHCTGADDVCEACRADGTCDNWGYSALWLQHPAVSPGPGSWRRFEYFIDYDERYFTVWVDGHVVADDERFVDGRIPYGPEREFHWTGFQLFYASTGDERDYAECVDGEGVCAGWQIDDLEVWDGLPPR